MNILTSIPRLSHQEQFTAFIQVLAEKYKPVYIYCFSSIIESSVEDGCFLETDAVERRRYHLLMVTESSTRIENEVQQYVNEHFHDGNITILVHGREALNAALSANNRFFITVSNDGELLYSQDPMIKSFQVPSFIPTNAAAKAKKYFEHHKDLANGFLESAMGCLHTNNYRLGMFMMHQVVEQCCIALIRVHLGYRSEIHNLNRLLRLCDSFSPALSGFFQKDKESKRLFELMVRSYSAARYTDDFYVEQEDSEELYHQVAAFIELTKVMCYDKISALASTAAVYKQNKTEGGLNHG